VVLILAGAGVGALLLAIHLGAGLVAAAVICLACAGIGHRGSRAWPPPPHTIHHMP